MKTIDGKDIMKRARQGDRSAFQILVETFKTDLYQLAYRMLGNHHDAEDALQEIFISAYRSLANFRGDASVGSWLYRIAVNRCVDFQRRRKTVLSIAGDGVAEAGEIPEPEDADPSGNPERAHRAGRVRQAVDASVTMLSPLERSVFVLRHYQELALREIAETLERSEGTVKSVLFRAIRKVRDYLKCQDITIEEASK